MSKIKILPEILSNKIAAGEVVERPASVVKELIENALDAQSTRIIVEIESGGRTMIRVSDNGTGMTRDDALLSIERYATSKIFSDKDLFQIKTLGFRGEALPSIAAVSHFMLVTRDQASDSGTQIIVEGGKIKQVLETGAPPGTMVEVKQLFFNTPARRKFLKAIPTETGHIVDILSSVALSRSDVQFRLLHNGKIIKNWSISPDPKHRAASVLGKDVISVLHPLDLESGEIAIKGWIASPSITRSTPKSIYLFVNDRYVHDRMVQHGLFEGYQGRMMKGRYPIAVVFITVPHHQVDVNVHPTKHQVRFVQQQQIHQLVIAATSRALQKKDQSKWALLNSKKINDTQVSDRLFTYTPGENRSSFITAKPKKEDELLQKRKQDSLWDKTLFTDLRIIGQMHNTYIVCETENGMIIIDQHAAHERILYEQLQSTIGTASVASQSLLLPETLDLGYTEAAILHRLMPEMEKFGLSIESFGGNTFVIKSAPVFLIGREIKPLVRDILEKLSETGFAAGLQSALDECLILTACHGTIRANQALDYEEIKKLLIQLDHCINPSHCPHGRPTWIQWTLRSLEKDFHRTG